MESLGYIITNKFSIIAVDSNLQFGKGDGDDKEIFTIPNARKVYKISDNTLISILGLPHKITDLYKYILGIENSDKTYDGVIEDLESIFNSDMEKIIENLKKVSTVIDRYSDNEGVLNQENFLNHFKDNPNLRQIAKESLELMQSGTKSGTQIFLFTNENGQNYFGKYLSIGTNFSGGKSKEIPKDNFFFGLASALKESELIEHLQAEKILKIQEELKDDWELSEEAITNFKNNSKDILKSALIEISPFKLKPNIIFYELSAENTFNEPDFKLINVSFNRE